MVKKTRRWPPISADTSGLLNSFRPETEQGMLRIWRVLDRSVGKDIAGNARPAAFKGSVLLSTSPAPPGFTICDSSKKDLVARLNDDLGSRWSATSNSRSVRSDMQPLTRDTFFNGGIRLNQQPPRLPFFDRRGHSGGGLRPRTGDTVVDLGTGCGIIPLILAFRYPGVRVWGVELQEPLANRWRLKTSAANEMHPQVTVLACPTCAGHRPRCLRRAGWDLGRFQPPLSPRTVRSGESRAAAGAGPS